MRPRVHHDGHRVVLRRNHRHLHRVAPLHHVRAFVDQNRARILQPLLQHHLNRVVAPPQIVVQRLLPGLIAVHRLLAAIGHFPSLAPDIELHHVAVFGHVNAVVIGPLVILVRQRGPQVGIALVERSYVALNFLVLYIQPGLPAHCLQHRIQGLARLMRVLSRLVVGQLRSSLCLRKRRRRPRRHCQPRHYRQNPSRTLQSHPHLNALDANR